jgi:hypothetical protein
LLGATAKEKCGQRNENYEKNLHTRFLPMHGIGSSGKWQVVLGRSRLRSNFTSHVCSIKIGSGALYLLREISVAR